MLTNENILGRVVAQKSGTEKLWKLCVQQHTSVVLCEDLHVVTDSLVLRADLIN